MGGNPVDSALPASCVVIPFLHDLNKLLWRCDASYMPEATDGPEVAGACLSQPIGA